jgi:chemotaxis protein MotB
MSDEAAPLHNEIIIIRRKSRGDHGHHGGAWKIAYADFVTAMMAFFLVMWLINAANEKTKAQVASYFNPVKLTDTTTSKKGLNEPTKTTPSNTLKEKSPDIEGPEGKNDGEEKAEDQPTEKQAQEAKLKEEQLFKNPYGVLAQLAGQAVRGAPPGHSEKGLAIVEIAEPGHRGGSAFRDPFDPLAWQATPAAEQPPAPIEKVAEVAEVEVKKPQPPPVPAQPKNNVAKEVTPPPVPAEPPKELAKRPESSAAPEPTSQGDAAKSNAKVAIAIRKQLIQDLKQFNPDDNPTLEVKLTREGVLLSLTDSLNFDMFSVGSAEPKPELVLLMEKVAATLKNYDGKIVIRGHTDARRFKNRDYDNWRLSTARAQMAYYMLIRAGIDENSVERIEGYADRNLKNPAKPESAENRRIELLLKLDEP